MRRIKITLRQRPTKITVPIHNLANRIGITEASIAPSNIQLVTDDLETSLSMDLFVGEPIGAVGDCYLWRVDGYPIYSTENGVGGSAVKISSQMTQDLGLTQGVIDDFFLSYWDNSTLEDMQEVPMVHES